MINKNYLCIKITRNDEENTVLILKLLENEVIYDEGVVYWKKGVIYFDYTFDYERAYLIIKKY